MNVYCSHSNKVFTKASNYYKCPLCRFGWYGNDPIPVIIIGQTDPVDVNPKYNDAFVEKDLSKKNWTRCRVCKDLLEKRKHRLCALKVYLKELRKRHDETMENIMIVVRGFKRDK
jgi:phage FluMu protein Com